VRGLGLRHVTVVNDCHDVVGIITRANLTTTYLRACLAAKEEGRTLDGSGDEDVEEGEASSGSEEGTPSNLSPDDEDSD
jgi:hypothetical protein